MRRSTLCLMALAALALAVAPVIAQAETVKLHGATTVIDRVINPYKAAVEAKTGHTLEVVGNATGKGLVDLAEGRCDASLCSEPLDIGVMAAKVAGKEVDIKRLVFSVVKNDEIVFVVNSGNAVKSLTWEQIRDIHTGKIKNWRDVGGKDAPITVYCDTPTGGTRAMIKQIVMGGQEYTASVVSLNAVKKVGEMVAADPNGFGGLGKGFVVSGDTVVETRKLERPLGLITIGAPVGKVAAVIDAFKAEAAK